ncbi:hypothetical protein BRADI_1g12851v3 [Brachypodium distachyon]|uniref:Uncharacterized protein n=1 Tax=Brachypodium distachyon TaxID=15368 RepID=A0A2K2DJ85_BRADI|nr:hypothetical protein BRADI_1g12851v3 [Brachypodium distachyon]
MDSQLPHNLYPAGTACRLVAWFSIMTGEIGQHCLLLISDQILDIGGFTNCYADSCNRLFISTGKDVLEEDYSSPILKK